MVVEGRDGETIYYSTPVQDIEDIDPVIVEPNKHPHLCLLKLWVQDCEVSGTPHRWWRFKGTGSTTWYDCDSKTPMFIPGWEYKRVGPTSLVNGVGVQLGISTLDQFELLYRNNRYHVVFIADVTVIDLVRKKYCYSIRECSNMLQHFLDNRLMYLDEESAVERARAMIQWSNM